LHVPGRRAGDDAPLPARPEFWPASSSFGVFQAAAREFAAVQRGWRDFRMAQPSSRQGDPALPNYWSGIVPVAGSRTAQARMNQHAGVDKFHTSNAISGSR
jgi:hypothetical protein